MILTTLGYIIATLGMAVLTAITVKIVIFTLKKFVSLIKERLEIRRGKKVFVGKMKKIAKEAVKEAKKHDKVKSVKALEKMLDEEGVIMADVDENDNVDEDSIRLYQSPDIDPRIYKQLDKGEAIFAQ